LLRITSCPQWVQKRARGLLSWRQAGQTIGWDGGAGWLIEVPR
jgi:hypothetical protein